MKELFFFLIVIVFSNVSQIATALSGHSNFHGSIDSCSSNSFCMLNSASNADGLIEGYLSSGRNREYNLSSSLSRRFDIINSFTEDPRILCQRDIVVDKFRTPDEEPYVTKRFKDFLTSLNCPSYLITQLNQVYRIYKMHQSDPSIQSPQQQQLTTTALASVDIFETIVKSMILSLQLNQPEVFVKLILFFESKASGHQFTPSEMENILKLLDFTLFALFKPQISFETFEQVLNNFMNFSFKIWEEGIKKYLKIVKNLPENEENFDKINFLIESISIFIKNKNNFVIFIEPFDESGFSFISIYFKYLLRSGKVIEAKKFIFHELPSILNGKNLLAKDSHLMILITIEKQCWEMTNFIMKMAGSDFSLILSSEVIVNYLEKDSNLPKIHEIHLDPIEFKPEDNFIKKIFNIFSVKNTFEEIFAYFLSNKLFRQLDMLLSKFDHEFIDFESLSIHLKSTILLNDSDYNYLIIISLYYENLHFFVSEILKLTANDPDELNLLIIRLLNSLPEVYHTDGAIEGIVEISSGPEDLLDLALKSLAKPAIQIICKFFEVENDFEILDDCEAKAREVFFISNAGYEFVQVFNQNDESSFEIFIP